MKHAILCLFLVTQLTNALNLPPSYGKTQFIVGASEKELRSYDHQKTATQAAKKKLDEMPAQPNSVRVFFPPDDNVRDLLLDLIAVEQKYIYMAAFMITDKKIAQALVSAHHRGVQIEVITDSSCLKSERGKIMWLQEQGVPVYVYNGPTNNAMMSNIMHNKFIVFGCNVDKKQLVWTGSFNFTHSAQKHNQENVVLLSDSYAVERFGKQFEVLKRRCMKMAPVTLASSPSKSTSRVNIAKNSKQKFHRGKARRIA